MRRTPKPTEYDGYDIDKIRSIADIETVAEHLGLEMRKKGKNISILCPSHNDKHFGSCFLTQTGYYCHACGAHGDMFNLVCTVRNCTFPEACEFVCSIYGDTSTFKSATLEMPAKRILSDDTLTLIGLLPRSETKGLYSVVCFSEVDTNELNNDALTVNRDRKSYDWYPGENGTADSYYVVSECIDRYPLQTLLNTNEEAYNRLICTKAQEAAERYLDMIEMAKNPAKYYSDENPSLFLVAYKCNVAAEMFGMDEWTKCLMQKVKKCNQIRDEFDRQPINRNAKKGSQYKQRGANVFGNFRTHGVSS